MRTRVKIIFDMFKHFGYSGLELNKLLNVDVQLAKEIFFLIIPSALQ